MRVQRDPRRLLAVAQRRVEDQYSAWVFRLGHVTPCLSNLLLLGAGSRLLAAAGALFPPRGRRRSRRSRQSAIAAEGSARRPARSTRARRHAPNGRGNPAGCLSAEKGIDERTRPGTLVALVKMIGRISDTVNRRHRRPSRAVSTVGTASGSGFFVQGYVAHYGAPDLTLVSFGLLVIALMAGALSAWNSSRGSSRAGARRCGLGGTSVAAGSRPPTSSAGPER